MSFCSPRTLLLALLSLLVLVTPLAAHTRLLRSEPSPGKTHAFEVAVAALRSGPYRVAWTVISADGHAVSGEFEFVVEADRADEAELEALPPLILSEEVRPPARAQREGVVAAALARWLQLGALVLALGPLLFLLLVVRGEAGVPLLVGRSWAVAAAGAALLPVAALVLLGAQAVALAGTWAGGLSRDTVIPLLSGRWGSLWQIRFGLALLLVWLTVDGVLRARVRAAGVPRGRLVAALAVGALLIVVVSLGGHAATTPPVALSVAVNAVHIAATALWIGGLFAIVFVLLPVLRPAPPAERAERLAVLVPRFSSLALVAVTVLVATGIYQSWRLVGSLADLVGSPYGAALLVKLTLFSLLLVPAAVNRFVMKPQLRRATAAGGAGARRFGRLIGAEAALGVVILAVVGVLTGLPPARGEAAEPGYAGFTFEPPLEPPAIVLPLADGGTFDLTAQRGNAVLIFFGFTNCPDYCPLTLQDWRRVRAQLGESAERTRFVFVSVDPERDSPRIAADYARGFDPSFIGLAPDSAELARIEAGFLVRSMRQEREPEPGGGDAGGEHAAHAAGASSPAPADDYDVIHSTRYFLIGPDGSVRIMYAYGSAVEDVAADIRRMLER